VVDLNIGDTVGLEVWGQSGVRVRHRDFPGRADPISSDHRDGSRLFDQDATFCPQPVRDGSAVTLEAVNFPDRAVTLHPDATLHLDVGSGTAFVVREPL
jgi:hypothetical protein